MKTSSAKQKGRSLQNSVVLKFRELFKNILCVDDIKPAIMGTNGTDVVLSPSAKNLIAFDIEAKNVEKLVGVNLTNAIKQCESNSEPGRIPLLVFKKNNEPERVILKFNDFLNLVYPNNEISFNLNDSQKIIADLEQLKKKIIQFSYSKNDDISTNIV